MIQKENKSYLSTFVSLFKSQSDLSLGLAMCNLF